jgi:hypothetical protein
VDKRKRGSASITLPMANRGWHGPESEPSPGNNMPAESEPLCILVDSLRPIPFREGGEEMPIYSSKQLVETLRNFSSQKPRVLIFGKRNAPTLFIGIPGKLAAVEAYPDPPSGRSWSATPVTPYSSQDMWVTSEGEPSLFKAAWIMPIEDVIGIVAHVAEHDDLPDTVAWINLKGERLR